MLHSRAHRQRALAHLPARAAQPIERLESGVGPLYHAGSMMRTLPHCPRQRLGRRRLGGDQGHRKQLRRRRASA
eukprot:11129202-Lingulodinium_polyedra.AAC.1